MVEAESEIRASRTRRKILRDLLTQVPASEWIRMSGGDRQRELLLSLLFRTSIKLQTTLDLSFLRFAMTAQEAAVLACCDEAGNISAGKLALAMGRDKGKITRFVTRLEGRGLLARQRNPLDRRSSVIHLTRRGRRLAPRINLIFETMRKRLFAGIQPGDIDRVAAVLSQLFENVGQLKLETKPSRPRNVRRSEQVPEPKRQATLAG